VRSSLASARLRRILVAYTVNRLGTWFGVVALMVAVYEHTHSAVSVAALLLAWQALPAFVVPAVVARVEASVRRHELSGLYFFEAVATAAIAVLLWHFWLPALLLLAALDGTAALTANALLRSEVARVARDDVELQILGASQNDEPLEERVQDAERRANAALNVAFSTTFVLGPAIAGAAVAAAGASTALFIDVGSFLLCGVLLVDLHPHVEEAGGDSVRARLQAAWRHINEVPSLRALLIAETVALGFIEAGAPIEIAYIKSALHASARGFGLLLTAWGSGAVLGSVVFARMVSRPLAVMLSVGTFAIGAAYVGFAAAPSLAVACVAALVGGVGNGLQWPSLISVVQLVTPQDLYGRLMGAVESIGAVCTAIGLTLGGVLVAISSPRVAFSVVGLGAIASTFALLRLATGATRPRVRDERVPVATSPP
jgi:Major Facilitator Superfamily